MVFINFIPIGLADEQILVNECLLGNQTFSSDTTSQGLVGLWLQPEVTLCLSPANRVPHSQPRAGMLLLH